MVTRILAAAIGLAVILPVLIYGGPLGADIIVSLVALIALDEYAGMASPDARRRGLLTMVAPTALIFAAVLYGPAWTQGPALMVGGLVLLGAVLFRAAPVDDAADALARLVLGVAWVAGPLLALLLLRRVDHGVAWIFFALGVTWMGDTGGYFGGRFFGRNKLYPKISPKKTWEGVAGGVALAVATALVIRAVGLPELGLVECVVLAVVLDGLGVVGDLLESMLKRSFGVKDSGWIMPGHGGILDRIDGLLLTAPALYLWLVMRASL